MAKTITIDPITRIEGHLRIDVEIDGDQVRNAWSSGQMWRGIETILVGRVPREAWLFTQRICGVCTTVHAIASVRAVENALKLEIPLNAQLIRNLLVLGHGLHDHIVHFYHLSAFDWIDVVSALDADPADAAKLGQTLSDWPGNSVQQLRAVKDKVATFVASGQLGIFTNGYWGHPAMKAPPAVNLLAVSHYLQALEYQRAANKAVAILGGKTPNIQNLAVGGVANPINLDNQAALNMEQLYAIKGHLQKAKQFVEQVYIPDVIAVASLYPDWFGFGAGVTNYLAVPDLPLDTTGTEFDLPGGTVMDGDLATAKAITSFEDPYFRDNVAESVARSWYQGAAMLHPYKGETKPVPGEFDPAGKYSWVKAPRFEGRPMQVGPLAQIVTGLATGHPRTVKWVNAAVGMAKSLVNVDVVPAMLHSTLGRHLARALRAGMLAELSLEHWGRLMDNIGSGDMATFNEPVFPKGEVQGFGFHEAPRGVLSHWIVIENGKIKNYQCVVPSTWNAGPRDAEDQLGPYEASLVGNPIADSDRPLEALRTVHSFDPCIACAIHAVDSQGRALSRVRVL